MRLLLADYEHAHSVNQAGHCYYNVIWKNSMLKSYCALVTFEFHYLRKHLSCVILEISSCLSCIEVWKVENCKLHFLFIKKDKCMELSYPCACSPLITFEPTGNFLSHLVWTSCFMNPFYTFFNFQLSVMPKFWLFIFGLLYSVMSSWD